MKRLEKILIDSNEYGFQVSSPVLEENKPRLGSGRC
jgi:hypothetical protein